MSRLSSIGVPLLYFGWFDPARRSLPTASHSPGQLRLWSTYTPNAPASDCLPRRSRPCEHLQGQLCHHSPPRQETATYAAATCPSWPEFPLALASDGCRRLASAGHQLTWPQLLCGAIRNSVQLAQRFLPPTAFQKQPVLPSSFRLPSLLAPPENLKTRPSGQIIPPFLSYTFLQLVRCCASGPLGLLATLKCRKQKWACTCTRCAKA